MSSPDSQPNQYEIRIQGHLAPCWKEWLGCPNFTHTTMGETILACRVPDQAALHGLLAKIRDMNLKLISVTRIETSATDEEEHDAND